MKRKFIILRYQVLTVIKYSNDLKYSRFIIVKENARKIAQENYSTRVTSATCIIDYKSKTIELQAGKMDRLNKATEAVQKMFPESEGWSKVITKVTGRQI